MRRYEIGLFTWRWDGDSALAETFVTGLNEEREPKLFRLLVRVPESVSRALPSSGGFQLPLLSGFSAFKALSILPMIFSRRFCAIFVAFSRRCLEARWSRCETRDAAPSSTWQ